MTTDRNSRHDGYNVRASYAAGIFLEEALVQKLEVSKLLDWEVLGVRLNGEYLSNLRFADDIVLFCNTGDELQQMIEDLNREIERVGLKIIMQNTKLMSNSLGKEQEFLITSQPLEYVREYAYHANAQKGP